MSLFISSCKGQTPSNQTTNNLDSTSKSAQHPTIIRTLGTKCENVGCQLLDKDGNLWFSISGEGAYRYDGNSFTNFTTKDGLCNNDVGAIIQDGEGNILLGTKKGICMYDGIKFTKYPVPDTLSITSMLEDKEGVFISSTFSSDSFMWVLYINNETVPDSMIFLNELYDILPSKPLVSPSKSICFIYKLMSNI
jgi:hypothetical protein